MQVNVAFKVHGPRDEHARRYHNSATASPATCFDCIANGIGGRLLASRLRTELPYVEIFVAESGTLDARQNLVHPGARRALSRLPPALQHGQRQGGGLQNLTSGHTESPGMLCLAGKRLNRNPAAFVPGFYARLC